MIYIPDAKGRKDFRPFILLFVILTCFSTSIVFAQEYRKFPLGTLGGSESVAHALNEHRQVVGYSHTDPTSNLPRVAFIWDSVNGMQSLGTLGGTRSVALKINNVGQVCGNAQIASGETHAFFWDATQGMIDLGTLGGANSSILDMNELGQIVGIADTPNSERHLFLWDPDTGMQALGIVGGIDYHFDATINDAGNVAGYYKPPLQDEVAFYLFPPNGILYPFGTENSGFLDQNNLNWCAGWKTNPSPGPPLIAILWRPLFPLVTLGSLNECLGRALVVNDQNFAGGESASTVFDLCSEYTPQMFYFPWGSNIPLDAGLQTNNIGYTTTGGAIDINEKNQILFGNSGLLGPPYTSGSLFQSGTTVCLTELLGSPSPGEFCLALNGRDLNENGDIVGATI